MKRALLVGAVVAAPLLFATPAFAGGTHFSVEATVSCGQVVYHVHADKPTVLTATDVVSTVPMVSEQWTAPKGTSTHTYRLPSALRPPADDQVELAVSKLNYPIVRTDSVPWNCPPPPRPTGDYVHPSTKPVGSVSVSPSGRSPSGGHTKTGPGHPSKPCITTPPASTTAPASSSPVVPVSTPVTTSAPATTAPAVTGSTTAPNVPHASIAPSPVLASTGADPAPLAVIGASGVGIGAGLLLALRRKRGTHS